MNKPPFQKSGTTPKPEKVEPKAAEETSAPAAASAPAEPGKELVPNVTALPDADLNATLKSLRTEVRRREKEREAKRPKVGQQVRILRGRSKYVGKVGTAVIVRKSRCFVSVPEIEAPAYVLLTDVELVLQ